MAANESKLNVQSMTDEELRRVLSLASPFKPEDRGAARQELVHRGIVIHTATLADDDGVVRTHAADVEPRFQTRCGQGYFGRLSATSFELWDKVDCPECKAAFLTDVAFLADGAPLTIVGSDGVQRLTLDGAEHLLGGSRYCNECGADLDGNDPHNPECSQPDLCVICGEQVMLGSGEEAEMHDPAMFDPQLTEDERVVAQERTPSNGVCHAQCGLDRGWVVS